MRDNRASPPYVVSIIITKLNKKLDQPCQKTIIGINKSMPVNSTLGVQPVLTSIGMDKGIELKLCSLFDRHHAILLITFALLHPSQNHVEFVVEFSVS